jgi:hypothetical protein
MITQCFIHHLIERKKKENEEKAGTAVPHFILISMAFNSILES